MSSAYMYKPRYRCILPATYVVVVVVVGGGGGGIWTIDVMLSAFCLYCYHTKQTLSRKSTKTRTMSMSSLVKVCTFPGVQ